jgi:hypothetical protein
MKNESNQLFPTIRQWVLPYALNVRVVFQKKLNRFTTIAAKSQE